VLLGADPLTIERHSRALQKTYVGFASTGAELRGLSAIDVALWDLWGKATEQPVHQLLGGLCRESLRVYNTCAGSHYVRGDAGPKDQTTANWGLGRADASDAYDDLNGFLTDAGALAESLMAQGITGMKIWPFDFAAERTGGMDISAAELATALKPFEQIREAVGDGMDIMVELHSLWSLPAAKRIVMAVEEFNPYWIEDPVRANVPDAWVEIAAMTSAPLCGSELLATRFAFADAIERGAFGIVMPDITWCGGLTEARKIAVLADARHLPVAPHDCTGPVAFAACVHFALATPNALIQESVRAAYLGWYGDLVTELPRIEGGEVFPMAGPGLGTALRPELRERADARLRRSAA
jgi:L-alanine-DL-glutamate epimerase-like enolase superfamily enzyme